MTTRGAEPAYPLPNWDTFPWSAGTPAFFGTGLSKRDLAAIELRVPDTGDPEIDALIRSARRADFAGMAMQGLLANAEYIKAILGAAKKRGVDDEVAIAFSAKLFADALLAELEHTR